MTQVYTHDAHARIAERKEHGPVKVRDQLPNRGVLGRFNNRFALAITVAVGSMWCAYLFAGLALVSFPSAIKTGDKIVIVAWIAQTFLQLVLLPIIIVGQNLQAAAADKRAEQTYKDADAVLHTAIHIQKHLDAQDAEIQKILTAVAALRPDTPNDR